MAIESTSFSAPHAWTDWLLTVWQAAAAITFDVTVDQQNQPATH